MEQALKNTQIAHKFMKFMLTLKIFFKDEFKSGHSTYLIPFDHIVYTKRHIFPKIRDACDYVCPHQKKCDGHKFLNYVEMLWRSICYAVEEKKVYYRYFFFTDFKIKDGKILSWHAIPVEPKDLRNLSYSQGMSYLNI